MNTDPAPFVSQIDLPNAGVIGMMQCPGRNDSLANDVAALKASGIDIVVSLMQDKEYPDLPGFAEAMSLNRIEWVRIPIAPGHFPSDMVDWPAMRSTLVERIVNGSFVAIHCWGGLGRTGMIAADLLTEFGFDPAQAISKVREVRPGTIESEAQELWIKRVEDA